MPIIFLAPSLQQTSGWSRYSHDIITRIARQHFVAVLCHQEEDSFKNVIEQYTVLRNPLAYFHFPFWLIIDALRVRRIIVRVAKQHSDPLIIHATVGAYAMFFPFLVGIEARKFMTVHGTYSVLPLQMRITRWFYRLAYQTSDRVIAVSHYTKQHLLNHTKGFLADTKVYVMTNGVDYEEKPRDIHRHTDVFHILTVGAIKHRKGGHHLVRVARILKEQFDFHCLVTFVGFYKPDDEYYLALCRYIDDHDLHDVILFAGQVSQAELDAFHQKTDIFVLLSVHENGHYEGYPLVFHEAAMWGLPCIGTFDCGAEDAIKDRETGALVDPAQHQQIAKVIADIRFGKITIDAETCRSWAQQNDWSRKNLMEMYSLPK